MKITSINAGYFKLDGGAMFGVVPKSMWNKLNPADENNMCSWAMRCILIEDGNKLILVDNGMGDKQDQKFFSHYYLHGEDSLESSLYNAGYYFDEITDVFLTHLHFDHCGGSVRYKDANKTILETTFKNATYWSNKEHWDWAVNPNAREKASFLKENILPIQESGQLNWVSRNNAFIDGFEVIFVDGHTESMMLPLINYKGQKILFCADLLPSTGHLPLPYVMSYDVRPLLTLTEKSTILQRALDEGWVLFFEHDPVIECCMLERTEKGIRTSWVGKLTDLYG